MNRALDRALHNICNNIVGSWHEILFENKRSDTSAVFDVILKTFRILVNFQKMYGHFHYSMQIMYINGDKNGEGDLGSL